MVKLWTLAKVMRQKLDTENLNSEFASSNEKRSNAADHTGIETCVPIAEQAVVHSALPSVEWPENDKFSWERTSLREVVVYNAFFKQFFVILNEWETKTL